MAQSQWGNKNMGSKSVGATALAAAAIIATILFPGPGGISDDARLPYNPRGGQARELEELARWVERNIPDRQNPEVFENYIIPARNRILNFDYKPFTNPIVNGEVGSSEEAIKWLKNTMPSINKN